MSRAINVTVHRPDPPRELRADPLGDTIRKAILMAVAAKSGDDPADVAAQRYGRDHRLVQLVKAGVPGAGLADSATAPYESQDYVPSAADPAIPLALPRVRRVPFNVRVLQPDENTRGYWLSEKQSGPLSLISVTGPELKPKRLQGLAVVSFETLMDPRLDARVVEDLRRACFGVLNDGFFSSDAEGAGAPAGILHDVTATPSTGDPAADLGLLIEDYAGDLATAALLCDPVTAAQLALSGATFQGARIAGQGQVAGIPQWASRGIERGTEGGVLVLLDQAALTLGFEGFEIARSRDATLSMTDGEGGAVPVSMFQSDLVAFRISARANWRLARPGAVQAVTGADYATSVT